MLIQIFLDRFLRFSYIDGEDDQPFVGELLVNLFNQSLFISTIWTPRRPELQQDNFSLHRFIVEGLAPSVLARKRGAVWLSSSPAKADTANTANSRSTQKSVTRMARNHITARQETGDAGGIRIGLTSDAGPRRCDRKPTGKNHEVRQKN